MPQWIHNRARHIQAKNPGMSEQTAFAVATQQSHKLGKTPKGYGTSEGKKRAKSKFDKPKKEYVQSSDPRGIGRKLDKRMKKQAGIPGGLHDKALAEGKDPKIPSDQLRMGIGVEMEHTGDRAKSKEIAQDHLTEDEKYYTKLKKMEKGDGGGEEVTEAQKSKIREFLKAHNIKDDEVFHRFAEGLGVEPDDAEPIAYQMAHEKKAEERPSMPISYELIKLGGFSDELQKIAVPFGGRAIKDFFYHALGRPSLAKDVRAAKGFKNKAKEVALPVLFGGALAGGGAAAGYHGMKKHRQKDKTQLGRAYVTGARDMYGTLLSRARQRESQLRAMHRQSQSGK